MSGSPPLPPIRLRESDDRDPQRYGSIGQHVFSSIPKSRPYNLANPSEAPLETSHVLSPPVPNAYHTPLTLTQYEKQQLLQQLPQRLSQVPPAFSTSDGLPKSKPPGASVKSNQRKTKGHVVLACVPCKRAHLR